MEKQYPTIKNTMVCEDIRSELYKKLSFIGVYTGDTILTQSMPLTLPKLCVYQKLVGGQGEFTVALKVQDAEGKEFFTWKHDKVLLIEPSGVIDMCIQIANARFETEGIYKVLTFLDDLEKPRAVFEFQVKKGEVKPL